RKGSPGLNSLLGVGNCSIERGPAGSQAKRCDHQAGVAEYCLRLQQTLTFHAADQTVSSDIDIIEGERCCVAEADAMLVLGFIMREALRALLDDEPGRTSGCVCENTVSLGYTAVAYPLFVAVDV